MYQYFVELYSIDLYVTREDVNNSTMRILVATDNHLGYLEKDPIRGEDSFVTFEEILQCATREKVCTLTIF